MSARCTHDYRSRPSTARSNRSRRRRACASHPSANIAGRTVALAPDVPVAFDTPLAAHHRLIGRWAATHQSADRIVTRPEARAWIEQAFDRAVLDILRPFELTGLRVVALHGGGDLPPALAIISDGGGEIDLRWIGKTNLLKDTLLGPVAPTGWRAAAYRELETALHHALPVFSFDDLFHEYSTYFWDGETDDEGARQALIDWHGAARDEIGEDDLPSGMKARRPDYMLAANADPLKALPLALAAKIRDLRRAHKALAAIGSDRNAWHLDRDDLANYIPESEDWSWLPSLTLAPFDFFARELDAIGQMGMEQGFTDIAGICPLRDPAAVDRWLSSLKLGADLLVAAQALIDFDPMKRLPAR